MQAIIYTKPNCPYCDRAKALFKLRKIDYTEHDITVGDTLDEMKALVPNAKTVPQIWLDGEYTGGFDDTRAYLLAKDVA